MSKLFRKKVVFPIIALFVFVCSLAFMLLSTTKTYAEMSYNQVDALDVGSITSGTKTSGDFTFSQGTQAYTSLPAFDFVVTGKGDTVTITYNNTKQYDIRKVRLGVSVSIAYNADFKITKGTTSTTKAITNNNNTEFDVELPSSNDKIVFTFIATEDSPYASIKEVQFWVHEITLFEDQPQQTVTITAGTGIKSAYLSNTETATSGSVSGSGFDEESTVYGFVELKAGYIAPSDWTLISGTADTEDAIYRVASSTINGAAVDFGTFNATPKTKTITLDSNGGVGSGTIDLTYDQAAEASITEFSKESQYFKCWNTKADGTGNSYQPSLSVNNVNSLILSDTSTLYAKWVKNMVGDGSETNPYQIECVDHLEKFRDIVNGLNGETKNTSACAVLTRNIDLEGSSENQWAPIGINGSDNAYTGTFNGAGYVIKGLYISSTSNYAGLFGLVLDGTIENLTVDGIVTSTKAYVAGIAGGAQNTKFINCHNKADVTGYSENGGICGWATSASFEKCSNTGHITATGNGGGCSGGIVGALVGEPSLSTFPTVIKDCYNTGTISYTYNQGAKLGGIVGETCNQVSVERCHSVGEITVVALQNEYTGYIVGKHGDYETFSNNYYLGTKYKGAGQTTSDTEGQFKSLTAAEFKNKDNFATWDFENVWLMEDNYPVTFDTNLWIFNTHVTNENYSGNGWSYDKDTNTLTLEGFEYVDDGEVYDNFFGENQQFSSVISYEGSDKLVINLVGDNSIVNTTNDSNLVLTAIYSAGQLELVGTGSLYVSVMGEGKYSYAIASGSTIIIDGPTIEANAGEAIYFSAGLYLNVDGLDIISGSLYAYGEECSDDDLSYGICTANENITIGENVRALVASGYSNAIYGIVINAIEGIGWTDVDGTQGETKIEISPDGVDNIGNYKYISFIGITPEDVIGFINDIGNVEYTDLCKEKIDTARGAYDFLKDEEKAQVTNYNTLVEAENDYTNAGLVIGKINNIGDVEYTPEIKALIDDAREAYDALTQKAKNAVSNYNTLTQKEAYYKTLDDNYKSSQVIELIKNIGTITYSNESKKLIDNAKTEYDKLSTEAKALVTNYQTLTHDIEVYNHVDDVYKKIEAVKEVKYNDQTEEGLEAARIAYDNLTDEEKTLVINYDKLTTDEKTYSGLRNDHRTLVGWMVALGIMGGIILGLVIAYFLLFFVFNKWTLANGNPIRVFVIGKKNGKVRLLNMTLMIIYREENEVFNTKEELVK